MTDRLVRPPQDSTTVRGGGWREGAAVALGFASLTLLLTFPLVGQLGSVGRADTADGQFAIWNVAWVARTLVLDPMGVFDANIFYPNAGTLAYSEANLGAGVLAIPVYWATRNPYAAYNVVLLLSFMLSGTAMYYLARYLSASRGAAIVAGVAFAYSPYLFGHLPHIQLLMTAGLPLSGLAFHRLADHPTPRRAIALGLAMSAQAYLCAYYAVFNMLMIGYAVLLVASLRRLWTSSRYWGAVALAAGVAIAAVVPIFEPYLELQEQTDFTRSVDGARLYVAHWQSYLASPAYLHRWMLSFIGKNSEFLFPGFVAVVGGAVGGVVAFRAGGRSREIAWHYGSLTALSCWASFGPDLGLYRLMYDTVPGFDFLRAPSRFGIVTSFGLAVLASQAVATLLDRSSRPRTVAAVLIVIAAADAFVPFRFPSVPPASPAYRILAGLPDGAVLELPVYSRRFAFLRARYMLSSTVHWKPLVNAYSDYTPKGFEASAGALGQFPSDAAFEVLPKGVRYAVFHLDAYPNHGALTARLDEFAPYLRRVWADRETLLYEITGSPLPTP